MVAGGADIIRFRDENLSFGEFLKIGCNIRKTTGDAGAQFIVNNIIYAALVSAVEDIRVATEELRSVIIREKIRVY